MTTDVRAAREAAAERKDNLVLAVYGELFGSPNGELVLQDMLNAYHERVNPEVEEQVAGIEHPYRAYYVEGQRSVALALRETVRAALAAQRVNGASTDG